METTRAVAVLAILQSSVRCAMAPFDKSCVALLWNPHKHLCGFLPCGSCDPQLGVEALFPSVLRIALLTKYANTGF